MTKYLIGSCLLFMASLYMAAAPHGTLTASPPLEPMIVRYSPATSATRYSSLFDAYKVRPPWNVAGADFEVGADAGSAMRDPFLIDMPGVKVDHVNCTIEIFAPNTRIENYNFRNDSGFTCGGRWSIRTEGASTTIRNNQFSLSCFWRNSNPGFFNPVTAGTSASDFLFEHNTFDGGGNPTQGGSQCWTSQTAYADLVEVDSFGFCAIQYNWLKNSVSSSIVNYGGGCHVLHRWNLEENAGLILGAHKNFIQFTAGRHVAPIVMYNTGLQSTNGNNSQKYVGEMWQVDAQVGGTIARAEVARNVAISYRTSSGISSSYVIGFHALSGSSNYNGSIHENYVDSSGAYGALLIDETSSTFSLARCSGNIDMRSGKQIIGRFGAVSCV